MRNQFWATAIAFALAAIGSGSALAESSTPSVDAPPPALANEAGTGENSEWPHHEGIPYDYADIDRYGLPSEKDSLETFDAATDGAAGPAVEPVEFASSPAERAARMSADLILLRPAGVVRIGAGASLLAVISPFVAFGGDWSIVEQTLVGNDVRETFTKPLGKF